MIKKLKKFASFMLGAVIVAGNMPLTAFAASNLNPPLPSNYKSVKYMDDKTEITPIANAFSKQKPNRSEVVSYDNTKLDVVKYNKLTDALVPGYSGYQGLLDWYRTSYSVAVGQPSWFVSLNKTETDKIQRNGSSYVLKGDNLMTVKMYNSDAYRFNGREAYIKATLKEVVVEPNGEKDRAPYPASQGYNKNDGVRIFRVDATDIAFENFFYFKDASHRFQGGDGNSTTDENFSKKGAVFEFEVRYVDTDEKVEDIHTSMYFGDVDTDYRPSDAGKTDAQFADLVYNHRMSEGIRVDSPVDMLMSNRVNYTMRDKFIMPAVKASNPSASDGVDYYAIGKPNENLIAGNMHSYALGSILVPIIPDTDEILPKPKKMSSKSTVNKGDDITFTITQQLPSKAQRENKDFESIIVKDELQNGLEHKNTKVYLDNQLIDSSQYTLDTQNNVVNVTLKPELMREAFSKTLKIELTATATQHVNLTNIASVTIDNIKKTTDPVEVPAAEPDIKVTKEVDKTKVVRGDELEYTIGVENQNRDFTQEFDTEVVETPNNVIDLKTEPYDIKNAKSVTYEDGKYKIKGIEHNKKATFKLKAKTINIGNATNSVNIPNQPPVEVTTIVVNPIPSLVKTNNATADVQKGDTVQFTINASLPAIEGVESNLAKNFTVTDTLPDGLEIVGEINAPEGFVVNKTEKGFTATKAVVDKNGVDATFTYNAKITTDKLDRLTNTARLTGSTFEDLTSNSSVNPVAPHLDIVRSIDKTYLTNGEEFTYTYTVTNNGNGVAKTTTLDDMIPGYLERVDNKDNNGKVHFDLGDIPVGDSRTVTIKLRLKKDTPKIPSVDANASTTCINGNTATADISTPTEYPVFELTKTADSEKYQIGDIATFKINVKQLNTKVAKTYNAVVKDLLPNDLELVEMTSEHGVVNGTTVTYDEFTTDDVITVKAKVLSYGDKTNTATLNVPNEPELTSKVTIKSLEPKYTVVKSVDKNEASIGDTLTYNVVITNTGEVPIKNAQFKDTLDSQLAGINATIDKGNVTMNDSVVTGTFDLEVGETATVTITAKIISSHEITYRDTVLNTATVTVGEIPPVTSNEVQTKLNKPSAEIQKLVDKTKLTEDEYATYTLRVIPKNGVPTNVQIHDTLPEYMELDKDSITSNVGTATIDGRDMKFFAERLEQPAEITYRAKALKNGEHVNTLEVNIPGIPTLRTTATTKKVATNVEVAKEADVAKTYVSEDVNYTINVTKDAAIAKNVVVEDSIPENIKLDKDSVKVDTHDKYELEVTDNKIIVKVENMTQDFKITYKANAEKAGEAVNVVSVISKDTEKKTAKATVEIIDPAAQLSKIITNEGKFKVVGDYIEYKLHVSTKDKFVNNVVLEDKLPAGVELDKNSIKVDTADEYKLDTGHNSFKLKMSKMSKDFTVTYRARVLEYGTYKNVATLQVPNKALLEAEATTKLDKPATPVTPHTGVENNTEVFACLAGLSALLMCIAARKRMAKN